MKSTGRKIEDGDHVGTQELARYVLQTRKEQQMYLALLERTREQLFELRDKVAKIREING